MTQELTPAGWYGDPGDASQQRYWDGVQWTDDVAPASTPQAPVAARSRKASIVLSSIAIGLGLLSLAITAYGFHVRAEREAERETLDAQRTADMWDERAAVDVSGLRSQIDRFYALSEGELSIRAEGDAYLLEGDDFSGSAVRTEGIEFGGFAGTGPDDWCVWATAPAGNLKDAQFSAQDGRAFGRC